LHSCTLEQHCTLVAWTEWGAQMGTVRTVVPCCNGPQAQHVSTHPCVWACGCIRIGRTAQQPSPVTPACGSHTFESCLAR
jgi:hypothetical protein